jgi:hypothetical protein
VIVRSPLGFSLTNLVAKNEAGRKSLLGESSMSTSGDDQDEETGVTYDDSRS